MPDQDDDGGATATWKLIKASSPEWEKEFATEEAATAELRTHICGNCLAGKLAYVDSSQEGGFGVEEREPPDPDSAADLLSTSCGCEYWLEKPGSGSAGLGAATEATESKESE